MENAPFPYYLTHKGGVIADLGGEGNTLCVTAHLDDIGLMVRHVNADGMADEHVARDVRARSCVS